MRKELYIGHLVLDSADAVCHICGKSVENLEDKDCDPVLIVIEGGRVQWKRKDGSDLHYPPFRLSDELSKFGFDSGTLGHDVITNFVKEKILRRWPHAQFRQVESSGHFYLRCLGVDEQEVIKYLEEEE